MHMEGGSVNTLLNMGFRWQAAGGVVVSLLQLAGLLILGRWMNAAELGLFALFQMAFRFGVAIFEPGFFVSLVHFQNTTKNVTEVFSNYQRILLGVVCVVLFFVYIKEGAAGQTITIYFFSAAALSIQALFAIFPVRLTVSLKQRELAIAQMLAYLAEFVSLFILIKFLPPLIVFSLALVLRLIVYYLCCYFFQMAEPPHANIEVGDLVKMRRYGINFQFNNLLSYFQGIYDNIFIGYTFGLAVLGPYHLACEISYILFSKINPIFNKTLFPILSKHKKDLVACRSVVMESLLSFLLIMVPLYLWLWVNKSYIVTLAYPAHGPLVSDYMYWILLIAMFKAINNILFSYILSAGKSKFILSWNIAVLVLNYAVLALAFVNHWSITFFLQVNLVLSMLSLIILLEVVSYYFSFEVPLLFLLKRFVVLGLLLVGLCYSVHFLTGAHVYRLIISSAGILVLLIALFPRRMKLFSQFKIVP